MNDARSLEVSGGATGPGQSRAAIAVLAVGLVVRLVFAAVLPLFPDEAYYWDWSRHLAPGYFDHPPGVALTVRFGTALLSPFGLGLSALAVRLGPVLAGIIAAVFTVAIARRIAGDGAALVGALVMTVLPLAAAGLVLAAPDAPLLATSSVALYCVVRALEEPMRSNGSLRWWALTGLFLGAAFWSKYTSILLPVGVLIAVLAHAELRKRLREPGPYVACVIATLVFVPVLVWNYHHDWISFTYQLRHGLGTAPGSVVVAALEREGDFLGGQAGLASPILFVMAAVAVGRTLRRRKNPAEFVLAVIATVAFALFTASALKKRVEPNWPAPAYIPALALVAVHAWSDRARKWLKAGIWLAATLSLIVYVQAVVNILPVRPGRDPVARAFGWTELTNAVVGAQRMLERRTGTRAWSGGDRYQEAAEIAFHDPAHPSTFAVNMSGRPNQYDLWPRFPRRARVGDDLVLALDDTPDPHPAAAALQPYFQSMERGALVELRRGEGLVGKRRLWLLSGWRGGWPASGEPH